MGAILGADCKLYRNTGTVNSPTWDEVTIVRDLTLNLEKGEADATTRGAGGWEQILAGLKKASVDFEIVWDKASADFTAFKDAFFNGTTVECAVLDGVANTNGTSGLRSDMAVIAFNRNEQLQQAVNAGIKMRPGYSSTAPSWMIVSS